MRADPTRAERIAGGLVQLAVACWQARVVENHDLDATALETALARALPSSAA